MTTPCATCRHEVDHLIALDIAIADLRAKARTHRGPRVLRGLNVGEFLSYIEAARKATRRHRKHRRDEHLNERRDVLREFAAHLIDHAEGEAA